MDFVDLLASADVQTRQVLGEDILYAAGGGATVTVRGIYDAAYYREDLQNPGVSSSSPAVFLRLGELPGDPVADLEARITRQGVTYRVHEVKPDGLGGGHFLLNRI